MNFNTTDGTRMIRFFSIFWIIIVLHTRMIRFFSIFWIITVLQISFNTKSNDVLSHYSMHKYSVVYFSYAYLWFCSILNNNARNFFLNKVAVACFGFFMQCKNIFVPWFRLLYWNSFVHRISVVYILAYTYLLFLINEPMFAGITHNTM